MSDGTLPKSIDIGRLDAGGARFVGAVPLTTMHRLRELVITSAGEVNAAVEVDFKEAMQVIVTGVATTRVHRECQRCLEPKAILLRAPFRLFVVGSFAEAEALGQDADPLIAPGGVIDLLTALEDELLLALPSVTRHGQDEVCEQHRMHTRASGAVEGALHQQSPFGVLEQLKKRGD
ncbi:YceD family protein [Nitrococcus mobilis]|uniref:Large ribosomal RNA subunit accumulation protein YceD n=1 Tax=Nitrococcus mobilis Nb-231 TaxID=314278 RepID=A4BML6_9GAMM|nr:YceD family protein [Nitrococcus mobilis]EAR23554.1 hypothetical protein NB231_17078 [Nitrococcus mobilis Nb-231]